MLEKNIQRIIVKWLKSEKIFHFKVHQTGFSQSGIPDIVACKYGRFIGLEVKTKKGRSSKLQVHQGCLIERSGGIYVVVRSLDDVKRVFESICEG